jgi:hypothetical protein
MRTFTAIIILSLLLAGCSATAGNFCHVSAPIRPSASDILTDGTARQVLTHNRYGAEVCGWRP